MKKTKKKIKKLKKKFPQTLITSDENVIFKNNDINLVSIASYDQDHYKQIIKCIKSNKNIIIEKPMCLKQTELVDIKKLLMKKKM